MKIRLGYACVPVTINETSSHTLTYTNYKKLGIKGNEKLDSVIKSNFNALENILKYNIKNDITFFRMTSELLPNVISLRNYIRNCVVFIIINLKFN